MTDTPSPAQVAAGLTKAQVVIVMWIGRWAEMPAGASMHGADNSTARTLDAIGLTAVKRVAGRQPSKRREITPLGLAVRAHLQENGGG